MSVIIVVFLTLPVHEFAHGFVAYKLGDPTPRYQGRLTLNPIAHLDPIGSLGILLFGIGWAKPVSVNARYFKNPKWGMALTALAGPVSNVIMAFIALVLMNTFALISNNFGISGGIYLLFIYFFTYIAKINVYLAVFNFIPIPPFDGSRILFAFLPSKYYFGIMRYERFIFIGLLVILYLGVLSYPISYVSNLILGGLAFIAGLPFGF
ncbi:MAG: site-2 protease family protein [Clostridia bacterium]|nr:site-2 protease family protein [Clostridia bacterium]